MDSEIKDLLKENLELSKENNELLHRVRGFQRWSRITKAIYWFLIIGVSAGSFYFIQPYLEKIFSLSSSGIFNIKTVKNLDKSFIKKPRGI